MSLSLSQLSPRQRQIIDLVAKGLPNKQIAQNLSLSPRTVKIHRSTAISRIGARTTNQAIRAIHAAEVADLKAEIDRLNAIISGQSAADNESLKGAVQ